MSDSALANFRLASLSSVSNRLTSSFKILTSSLNFLSDYSRTPILLFLVLMVSLAVFRSFFALVKSAPNTLLSPSRLAMVVFARSY